MGFTPLQNGNINSSYSVCWEGIHSLFFEWIKLQAYSREENKWKKGRELPIQWFKASIFFCYKRLTEGAYSLGEHAGEHDTSSGEKSGNEPGKGASIAASDLTGEAGKSELNSGTNLFMPVYAFLFLYDEIVVFNDAYEPIAAQP